MWLLLLLLVPLLRLFLKLVGVVLLIGLLLSIIQIAVALPVAAFEQLAGSPVPETAYQGLCVVLFINLVSLYVKRRRRMRQAAQKGL